MRALRLLAVALVVLAASSAAAGFPTVTHEGRAYVELTRIAEALEAPLDATSESTQARLRSGGHVVVFTRNWARVLVDGAPVVLDSPVRVTKKGVWLIPEAFVVAVMPRLAPAPATPAVASAPTSPPPVNSAPAPARAAPASSKPAPAPGRAAPAPAKPAPVEPVSLAEMRYRSYPSFTRVVLETSGALGHRVEPGAPGETRLRLVGLTADPRTESIGDGFVEAVRLERAGADAILRATFEGTPGELRVSSLADPPRLVLDFRRPADASREREQALAPLRTIVLDAGHGGHDSGAVGPGGLMEKDLVLDVTRRVAGLLETRLDVRVRLSRDGDYFVPLRDRTSFANRERADVFVSIHANAHRESASAGVEIYFLSSEATDSAARQVAALENNVIQLEKPAAPGGGRNRADIVRTILWDLAQSEFQVESSRLAETVLDSMTRSLRIPNRGVKQAGFYVLGGAAMPAVLIEIGFVTNPREERRLKDARYRDEIARAIYTALAEYKRQWDQRVRATAERAR